MGLSLVAILLVLGGAGLLIIQLIAFSKLEEMSSLINVSNYVLQGAFVFVGLLGVAAGVGTWIGAKWGWWLAVKRLQPFLRQKKRRNGKLCLLYLPFV
ncbi:hypothetical protein D3C80_1807170 [compost metagenome]